MQRYLVRRLLQAVVALLAMSVLVFALARLSGDPRNLLLSEAATKAEWEEMGRMLRLDRPIPVQYLVWLGRAFRGDLGDSIKLGKPTLGLVLERLPATLQLAGSAMLVAVVISFPIGVLSAVKRDTIFDKLGKVIALLGQSVPSFWLAIVFIFVFGVQLGWFPVMGRGGINHLIMPALAMGWYVTAGIMRLVRSSMLEALDSDYVTFARIKGVPEWQVVWKHALRNALISPLTFAAVILGGMLHGSVVIETVFAWPGMGLLTIQGIRWRDYPVVQTVILLSASIYIGINLVTDVLYAYLDPRIRYG